MKKLTAVVLAMVLALMSCAVAETVENEVTVIALGETVNLMVEAAQAENAQTVWTSSDESIITVDANGAATALNAGEAVITAAVTATMIETIEKTAYEVVHETNAEGQLVARRVEKTVSEEVEKVVEEEIAINVAVEIALCPGCGAEYANAEEYKAHVQIAVCGAEGHYVCDGEDHETELDEFCRNENPHRICQAGAAEHECESCGATYACEDSGSHATCLACGNFWCYKDEGDHFTPACGKLEHRPCMQDDFRKSEHYRCKLCNHRKCSGGKHGIGKCVEAPAAE